MPSEPSARSIKTGDRVRIACPLARHNGDVGQVVKVLSSGMVVVRFVHNDERGYEPYRVRKVRT